MGLPRGKPSEIRVLLGCFLRLRSWLFLRFDGLPRFLLRGEFLLDLEGHGIGIHSVDLGGGAENLASVGLGPRGEQNHSFDNQLADCAFVGLADEGG